MPVIKSAKKKLRHDIKRQKENKKLKNLLLDLIKRATRSKEEKAIKSAVKAADKAAKKHIIHKNKAARIKSKLSKLSVPTPPSTPKKKTSPKKK